MTIARFRSEEGAFRSAEVRLKALQDGAAQSAMETRKLEERLAAAQQEYARGLAKLKGTGQQLLALSKGLRAMERNTDGGYIGSDSLGARDTQIIHAQRCWGICGSCQARRHCSCGARRRRWRPPRSSNARRWSGTSTACSSRDWSRLQHACDGTCIYKTSMKDLQQHQRFSAVGRGCCHPGVFAVLRAQPAVPAGRGFPAACFARRRRASAESPPQSAR